MPEPFFNFEKQSSKKNINALKNYYISKFDVTFNAENPNAYQKSIEKLSQLNQNTIT